MVTVVARNCRLPVASFAAFKQPRRFRYIPSPGTMDQRLFREVTKPIYRVPTLSRQGRYVAVLEEFEKRREQNPYRSFLIRKAKTDFYDKAEGKMVLIFHQLYAYQWEKQPVINRLFEHGLKFRGFPMEILREAAKGTKWQRFADTVLKEPIPNLYLFGDADPRICEKAINITSKTRFFILLGGVIQYRIMTRDEVKKFASLAELPALHAELSGTLQQPTIETARLLNHHGGELANLLQYHTQSANGSSGAQSGSNGQANNSSSSSDDSDSSDSDSD